MADKRLKCVAVRSPRGARVTEIDWGDGHKGVYPHEILRGWCPCAGCQGHKEVTFHPPKGDIQTQLEDIAPMGNYALQLTWFDGHDTGIYSYKYLRDICACETCNPAKAR